MALDNALLVRPGKYVINSLSLSINLTRMYSYVLLCCLREQSNLSSSSVHFAGASVGVFEFDFLVGEVVSEPGVSLLMVMMCGCTECRKQVAR